MPHRQNKNLSTTPIVKELRGLAAASDAYDMDNVYLTEEGWVYRHYKKSDQSVWWDEIISAGQVDGDDPQNSPVIKTVSASPDRVHLGTSAEADVTFETGDGKKDYEYASSTEVTEGSIGPTSISGNTGPVADGTTETYTAKADSSTVGDLTYAWTASDDAAIQGDADKETVTVVFTHSAGNASLACTISSTDDEFDGDDKTATLAIVVDEPFTLDAVTLTGPTSIDTDVATSYTPGFTGNVDDVTYVLTSSEGSDTISDMDFTASSSAFGDRTLTLTGTSVKAGTSKTATLVVKGLATLTAATITGDAVASTGNTRTYSPSHTGNATDVVFVLKSDKASDSISNYDVTFSNTTGDHDLTFEATSAQAGGKTVTSPALTVNVLHNNNTGAATVAWDNTASTADDGSYTDMPTTATSGSGTGLTINFQVAGGVASNATVASSGVGYAQSDHAVVDGDTVAVTVATLGEDQATSVAATAVSETGPKAISGYYPLYDLEASANAAGDGSSHTHEFDGTTYYMPNGVTFYHGNYGSSGY